MAIRSKLMAINKMIGQLIVCYDTKRQLDTTLNLAQYSF